MESPLPRECHFSEGRSMLTRQSALFKQEHLLFDQVIVAYIDCERCSRESCTTGYRNVSAENEP